MAKVAYRRILEGFSFDYGNGRTEDFKKGELAMCLPELDKDNEYCVASDFHVPVWADKKYLSERLYDNFLLNYGSET